MSETTRTASPVGSVNSTLSPPTLSGSFVAVAPVASASRRTSAESAARNAGPTNRDRPWRISTHGAPGSVPRSCSASGVRSAVLNPKACANASARSRFGFSNSNQARSCTFTTGFFARPGVLARQSTLLAVQTGVRVVMVAHRPLLSDV